MCGMHGKTQEIAQMAVPAETQSLGGVGVSGAVVDFILYVAQAGLELTLLPS